MTSNNRLRLRELHLNRMKRPLSGLEEKEYKTLKRCWGAGSLCRELDEVYADPDFRELLHTKPTDQRWYDLVEKLSNM